MRKTLLVVLAMALVPFCAFAVDGVTQINQSTVMAAGGFPYTITQPGSYRLSGNLTVPNENTTAIRINADNVTIDLNGFSIIGPTVCTGSPVTSCSPTGNGKGVYSSGQDITVVNGGVRGMGSIGIALYGFSSTVEKVRVSSNGSSGIELQGSVSDSEINSNGGLGIFAQVYTVVSGNRVSFNGTYGLYVYCPSSVVGNLAAQNGAPNLSISGAGCAVANNAAP